MVVAFVIVGVVLVVGGMGSLALAKTIFPSDPIVGVTIGGAGLVIGFVVLTAAVAVYIQRNPNQVANLSPGGRVFSRILTVGAPALLIVLGAGLLAFFIPRVAQTGGAVPWSLTLFGIVSVIAGIGAGIMLFLTTRRARQAGGSDAPPPGW